MAKNRPARVVIEERRRQVLGLMLQGYASSHILNQLSSVFPTLTQKTVENDMCTLNRQLRLQATQLDISQEIGRALAVYDELEREAWTILDSSTLTKASLKAMKVVADIRCSRIKLLERAGIICPVAQVVNEPMDSWEDQVKRLRQLRGLGDAE